MSTSAIGVWLLCGFAAVVFATFATGKWYRIAVLAAGFAIASLIPGQRLPDATTVGCLLALVAVLQLFRPGTVLLTAFSGGAAAGLLGGLIRNQGIPAAAAIPFAIAIAAVASYLAARHAEYAPRPMRDEALVVVFALAIAVGLGPEISAGWRSALALNIEDKSSLDRMMPLWVLVVGGMSLTLGGVYSLWRRR